MRISTIVSMAKTIMTLFRGGEGQSIILWVPHRMGIPVRPSNLPCTLFTTPRSYTILWLDRRSLTVHLLAPFLTRYERFSSYCFVPRTSALFDGAVLIRDIFQSGSVCTLITHVICKGTQSPTCALELHDSLRFSTTSRMRTVPTV